PEFLHEQSRRLGFRVLLAARAGLDRADIVHRDAHGEAARMVGAGGFANLVFGRAALVARGPFLQRALGVFRAARAPLDRLAPDVAYQLARLLETRIEEIGAEQRLHDVAQHVVAVV